MNKTLVIHPKDSSTEFLCPIYEGRGWTVIRDSLTSKSSMRGLINSHDRVVMLGHGTEKGLGRIVTEYGIETFGGFIIDSSFVDLLREKQGVYIWCNADKFVSKYELTGFYTGMIISDEDEAEMFLLHPFIKENITSSNSLFTESIKQSIDKDKMLEEAEKIYDSEDNPVIGFNKEKMYSR